MKKAVACVSIEHLGATEWADYPATNEYKPTGGLEWNVTYTPSRAEGELFLKAADGTEAKSVYTYQPKGPWGGEGANFFRAGISTTIGYLPMPQYLFGTGERRRDR